MLIIVRKNLFDKQKHCSHLERCIVEGQRLIISNITLRKKYLFYDLQGSAVHKTPLKMPAIRPPYIVFENFGFWIILFF